MILETGQILLKMGTNASLCKDGNDPPGSLNANELIHDIDIFLHYDQSTDIDTEVESECR